MKKNLTLISLMLGVMLILGVSATTTTSSGMYVSDVSLNGESNIIVQSGDDVDTEVTVTAWGSGEGNDWESTAYMIEGQDWICVNTADHLFSGVNEESFTITMPSLGIGFYDFSVRAYRDSDSCSGYSDDFVLTNAIVVTDSRPACTLTVNAFEGSYINDGEAYFDSESVDIEWTLSEGCTPIDHFEIYYERDGTCDPDSANWAFVPGAEHLTQSVVGTSSPYTYLWDKPTTSGQYCVKVKVTSNGARDVSEIINVDHAKPYVNMTVGTPQDEECTEGVGTCYVNQNTDITLTCADDNPDEEWQSGVDYIQYSINGGDAVTVDGASAVFNFGEDSNHVLEYWCYDNVGKEALHKTKNFAVESQAPIITKVVGEPKVSGCDETWEDCDWYVNTETELCLSAVDNGPHPSNEVEVSCEYSWWATDFRAEPSGHVTVELDENGCFSYNEGSYHELHCTASDALENTAHLYEADIVDDKAPITLLSYTGPYYSNDNGQYIDGVSRVVLSSADQEPHPVNGVLTYYRYGIVDNSYCYGTNEEKFPGLTGEWTLYSESFGMEESCHAIEYYSIDALANAEEISTEFVFVDKTAPTLYKEVGKPSHECTDIDLFGVCEEGWDWKVTMNTPITLSCNDEGNHPSGVQKLCYKITWDGGDISNERYYTNTELSQDGYHCVNDDSTTIYFTEECVHTLDFYCTDNVGKTSEVDTEVFKVEGNSFTIDLDKKWNLISVPVNLLSSDVEEVFGNDPNIESVWGYENGDWKVYVPGEGGDLKEILPGHGYWVRTYGKTSIVIGGELFSEATTPSSVELEKGWNLIGHYGLPSKSAYCSLFSLVDTQEGFPRWSSLWGYNSDDQRFRPLSTGDYTHAGRGYWVEMDVEDSYSPSSICYGFTD